MHDLDRVQSEAQEADEIFRNIFARVGRWLGGRPAPAQLPALPGSIYRETPERAALLSQLAAAQRELDEMLRDQPGVEGSVRPVYERMVRTQRAKIAGLQERLRRLG